MNNRVRSVIPPRRLLHWQAGGSSSISVWKQLRVSTQPARGLRSLSGELALSSHIPYRLHCFYSFLPSFFFHFLAACSSRMFVCHRVLWVGSSRFVCLVSGCWICEESQSGAQDGGDTCGFWRDWSMMPGLILRCIVIYYHKGPLAFKVLPLSPPAVYRSQSITASEDCWALAD